MPTPKDVVEKFIAAWPTGDAAKIASFFAADAVYHNIPMEPITGREAIEAAVAGFLAMVEEIRFETLHLLHDGDLVMTERIDHFVGQEKTISLPVMGVFEVHGGLITAWRDYFDLQQFTSQMPSAT